MHLWFEQSGNGRVLEMTPVTFRQFTIVLEAYLDAFTVLAICRSIRFATSVCMFSHDEDGALFGCINKPTRAILRATTVAVPASSAVYIHSFHWHSQTLFSLLNCELTPASKEAVATGLLTAQHQATW